MTVWLDIGGKRRRVEMPATVFESGGATVCNVDGHTVEVDACMIAPGVLSMLVAGRQFRCVLDRDLDGEVLLIAGERVPFSVADPRSLAGQSGAGADVDGPRVVKAPMHGRVVRVLAAAGEMVEEHQGLVVIEAMKMQNELRSPKAGRLVRISVEVGATVAMGDTLAVIE